MGLDIDIFRFPKNGVVNRKNVYRNENYEAFLVGYFRKFYPLEWLSSYTYNNGFIHEGIVDTELNKASFRLFRIHINKLKSGYVYKEDGRECSIDTIDIDKLNKFESLVNWCLTQDFDIHSFYYSSCP